MSGAAEENPGGRAGDPFDGVPPGWARALRLTNINRSFSAHSNSYIGDRIASSKGGRKVMNRCDKCEKPVTDPPQICESGNGVEKCTKHGTANVRIVNSRCHFCHELDFDPKQTCPKRTDGKRCQVHLGVVVNQCYFCQELDFDRKQACPKRADGERCQKRLSVVASRCYFCKELNFDPKQACPKRADGELCQTTASLNASHNNQGKEPKHQRDKEAKDVLLVRQKARRSWQSARKADLVEAGIITKSMTTQEKNKLIEGETKDWKQSGSKCNPTACTGKARCECGWCEFSVAWQL